MRVCKERGCYKVILDCAEHNVAFYEKCGLTKKEVQMVSVRAKLHSACMTADGAYTFTTHH